MSPVLPLLSRLRPRRPVRRPAVHLLPFCSDAQDPKPEAGALAEGLPGWRTGSLESPSADCPPPHLATPPVPLVGIARLAAKSPTAQTKRSSAGKPEYFFLPVKSILNHCDSKRVPFDWTVNPYRGCEFGCKYCYARYTHEYMEIDGGEYEQKIFVSVKGLGLHPGRAYRDRDGDRSLPAGRKGIWRHAGMPRGVGQARGFERLRDHQVEPDCTGHRPLSAHRSEVRPVSEYHGDNLEAASGSPA